VKMLINVSCEFNKQSPPIKFVEKLSYFFNCFCDNILRIL